MGIRPRWMADAKHNNSQNILYSLIWQLCLLKAQLPQKKRHFNMCKKYIVILLCMLALLIASAAPCVSFAGSYGVNDKEMTIYFDDETWTVFTRDNIKDNQKLEQLGVSYQNMKSSMENSSAYIVAFQGSEEKRLEVLVRAIKNKYINNMSTLKDDERKALLKGIDETYEDSMDDYQSQLCRFGDYQYVKMTGTYEKGDYETIEYFTIINGNNYLISAQKAGVFTKEERNELENMVQGITFQVNPELTENQVDAYVKERQQQMEQNSSKSMGLPEKIAATAMVAIAIILILKFKNRRRKKA